MTKTIELTSLQLRLAIQAIGGYRHDMKEDLDKTEEAILNIVENQMIKKYREIRPTFIPFY